MGVGGAAQLNYDKQGHIQTPVRKFPRGDQPHRTSFTAAPFLITPSGNPPSSQAVYVPQKMSRPSTNQNVKAAFPKPCIYQSHEQEGLQGGNS